MSYWLLLILPVPLLLVLFVIDGVVFKWRVTRIIGDGLFLIGCELQIAKYQLRDAMFGRVPDVSVRTIPINGAMLNDKRVVIADCPANVVVRRKSNRTLSIVTGTFGEKCYWMHWPCISFQVGIQTGRVRSLIVRYDKIRKLGSFFRHGCPDTEWKKYLTSVVTAHVEVLKFSQRRKCRHPALISRIFKHYGDQIFDEVA